MWAWSFVKITGHHPSDDVITTQKNSAIFHKLNLSRQYLTVWKHRVRSSADKVNAYSTMSTSSFGCARVFHLVNVELTVYGDRSWLSTSAGGASMSTVTFHRGSLQSCSTSVNRLIVNPFHSDASDTQSRDFPWQHTIRHAQKLTSCHMRTKQDKTARQILMKLCVSWKDFLQSSGRNLSRHGNSEI